ncbi:hypothetical protein BDW72DRAFT_197155 [Aspergillus terricola var. indicus]
MDLQSNNDKRLSALLGGFSEITAISQRAINAALSRLMETRPDLAHVKAKSRTDDTLDGLIKPAVSIKVAGSDRSHLEYQCPFSEGKLFLSFNDRQFDMAGWVIAFEVGFDHMVIEEGSEEDKQVRHAIDQPGDFSISALYLTFNEKWYVSGDSPMADRLNRTVAYGLHTEKPETMNNSAVSFPPTSLQLQTYEYLGPGQAEPVEGIEEGANNMVLYLQMIDHQRFPTEAVLNYSGNYLSAGMDGTMCIERAILWDKYLLRQAPPQLLHMLNVPTYAFVESTDLSNPLSPRWNIEFGGSSHPQDASFFEWKSDGRRKWSWKPDASEQKADKSQNWSSGDGESKSGRVEITCSTENTMTTASGSNKINMSGRTDMNIKVEGNMNVLFSALSRNYTMHIWIEWGTTATLDDPTQAFRIGYDKIEAHASYGWKATDDPKQILEDFVRKWLNKIKEIDLGEQERRLQKDLKGAARLALPGAGTFSYKNPVFNDNSDLLIEIAYED